MRIEVLHCASVAGLHHVHRAMRLSEFCSCLQPQPHSKSSHFDLHFAHIYWLQTSEWITDQALSHSHDSNLSCMFINALAPERPEERRDDTSRFFYCWGAISILISGLKVRQTWRAAKAIVALCLFSRSVSVKHTALSSFFPACTACINIVGCETVANARLLRSGSGVPRQRSSPTPCKSYWCHWTGSFEQLANVPRDGGSRQHRIVCYGYSMLACNSLGQVCDGSELSKVTTE